MDNRNEKRQSCEEDRGSGEGEKKTPIALGSKRVGLNVGGTIFRTTEATLTRFPGSFFDAMLSKGPMHHETDADGNFEIDMDPASFHTILECLRWGRFHYHPDLCCIDKVAEDADFLGLDLSQTLSEKEESCRSVSISGREIATKKASDVSSSALQCCLEWMNIPKLAREGIMEFKLVMNPPLPPKKRLIVPHPNYGSDCCGPVEFLSEFQYVDALFSQKIAQECFRRECTVRGYECTWKSESFPSARLDHISGDRLNPGHARYCFLNFLSDHLPRDVTYTFLVATLRFRGDDSGGKKSSVKARSDCRTSSSSSSKSSKNKRKRKPPPTRRNGSANPASSRGSHRGHPYRESADANKATEK